MDSTLANAPAALALTTTPDLSVVDVATSGEELKEKLATSRPEVAIVDANLPDEGGVSVIRRQRDPSPPPASSNYVDGHPQERRKEGRREL
jgi:DNA-binding NarL/FixJ family response regulator